MHKTDIDKEVGTPPQIKLRKEKNKWKKTVKTNWKNLVMTEFIKLKWFAKKIRCINIKLQKR